MGYLIGIVMIAVTVVFFFLLVVVIGVPWSEDSYKGQGHRLLSENSPDPGILRDTIEGLSACDDQEAKDLIAHLTVRLLEEEEAVEDDQEEA